MSLRSTSTVTLRAPQPDAVAVANVKRALQVPVARRSLPPGEIEMPWIWRVLREQVYSRMPTYEKRDESIKLVLSPVVVTSPSDTVPGVGISGDF